MWEFIRDVLLSQNGVALFLLFGILIFVCSKYGLFKVKTDKITIGMESSETERNIMRNQKEWCKLSLEAFERSMPKFEGYNQDRGTLIVEKVYDEMIDWIMLNHIRMEKKYIEAKQTKVWNIVQKWAVNEQMRSKDFEKQVNEQVKTVIKMLVEIREDYGKNNDV